MRIFYKLPQSYVVMGEVISKTNKSLKGKHRIYVYF